MQEANKSTCGTVLCYSESKLLNGVFSVEHQARNLVRIEKTRYAPLSPVHFVVTRNHLSYFCLASYYSLKDLICIFTVALWTASLVGSLESKGQKHSAAVT